MANAVELGRFIQKLQRDRVMLDQAISSLERLDALQKEARTYLRHRRGRKFMDEAGRMEVSERMKKYWASRRNQHNVDGDALPGPRT